MRRASIAIAAATFAASAFAANPTVETQDSGVAVRLRGISAVDANIAWASGREGTVLRTIDGGAHWTNVSVPEAKALDFRDVEGFDANTAIVLSIGPGDQSRVYRTQDAGKSWKLTLKNDDERAFFDCMVFEGQSGWMLGDPVDGRYQVRETRDGGRTWALQAKGPQALPDEAAFAASGTCIARGAKGALYIAGGGAASRIQSSRADATAWAPLPTDMPHRVPAAGIFSISNTVGPRALIVGGDFEHETQGSAAFLDQGAEGLAVRMLPPPPGYRSGAACFSVSLCIAVGPTGMEAIDAPPGGAQATWRPLSKTGYDAIDRAGMTAWASGDKGRIVRITFASKQPQASSPSNP